MRSKVLCAPNQYLSEIKSRHTKYVNVVKREKIWNFKFENNQLLIYTTMPHCEDI